MTTLVFAGNQFKYEMENVAKLFFPLQHFHFDYDGVPPEADYILFTREETGEGISLSVSVNLPDYQAESENTLPAGTPDNLCEEELARQLYRLLEAHTGIHPQWGILTGVRPVKLVQRGLAAGKTDEAVRAELKTRDLVSDHKLDLALKIAHVQEEVLRDLRPRDYSLYPVDPLLPQPVQLLQLRLPVGHRQKGPGTAAEVPDGADQRAAGDSGAGGTAGDAP